MLRQINGKTRNDRIKKELMFQKLKVMQNLTFKKVGENGATLQRILMTAQVKNNFVQVEHTLQG